MLSYNGSYVSCGRPTAATYTPTEVMVLPLGYSGSVGYTCRTLYGVVGHHPEKLLLKEVPGPVTVHGGHVAMGIHPAPCGVNSVPFAWPD